VRPSKVPRPGRRGLFSRQRGTAEGNLVTNLPCGFDPITLRVIVDDVWDLDALEEHVRGCPACSLIHWAMAVMTGSNGGRAGRGASKRRGSGEYYRALAGRRRNSAK
jgi:hypothetical protein